MLIQTKKNTNVNFCRQVFDLHSMRLHRQKKHKTKSVSETKLREMTQLMGAIDDESLKKELERREHFPVASELENGRHRVLNFAMDILDGHTLGQKINTVFEKLKCAAKWNVTFGFVLKILENGTGQYYYGNENNSLMER